MRLALIPPISMLEFTFTTDQQMMLPQLAYNFYYSSVYERHCKSEDTYVTLDNGIAEAISVLPSDLLALADRYNVNEVVIPDSMGDRKASWRLLVNFMQYSLHPTRDYMYVAHGSSIEDALDGCRDVAVIPYITCFGIPRLLGTTVGHDARLRLAEAIHSELPDFNIHFLGAISAWPGEIKYAAQLGYVRSLDTSLPFTYAMAGRSLLDKVETPIIRTAIYFHSVLSVPSLVHDNVALYREWAAG